MIVLDASVLIGFFEAPDAHHERAVELILRHAGDDFVASPLTLAEFLVGSARRGDQHLAEAERQVANLDLAQISLTEQSPRELAELRVETGLPLPDCAVLHAARQVGGAVASFDSRLSRAAEELGLPLA